MSTIQTCGKMSGFLCLGIGIVMLIATIWAINQPTFSSTQNIFSKLSYVLISLLFTHRS